MSATCERMYICIVYVCVLLWFLFLSVKTSPLFSPQQPRCRCERESQPPYYGVCTTAVLIVHCEHDQWNISQFETTYYIPPFCLPRTFLSLRVSFLEQGKRASPTKENLRLSRVFHRVRSAYLKSVHTAVFAVRGLRASCDFTPPPLRASHGVHQCWRGRFWRCRAVGRGGRKHSHY